MNLKQIQKNWDAFGKKDPYWAIITRPDKADRQWKEEEFFKTGQRRVTQLIRKIGQLDAQFSFGSALDFGCGVGRLTQALSMHFKQVTGVDIAPSMLKKAKEYNKHTDHCQYLLNERDDLRIFASNSFDLVYSLITLQHVKPLYIRRYIREFIRVLNPGGLAIFQVPSKPDAGTFAYHHPLVRITRKMASLTKKEEDSTPCMEMYWLPIDEAVKTIVSGKGIVRQIETDRSPGEGWESYIYYVSKN